MDTTDIFGLLYKAIVLNIIGDNSHVKDDPFTSQLGTGNILGTLQVYHIAVIFQIIEFSSPVRTNYQNINIIFNDVADLLTLIFFNNNLISQSGPAYIFDSLDQAVPHIQLPSLNIKALAGNTYDQVIPQSLRSFDNIVMALVKQIKGTICDYFFHDITPHSPCYASSGTVHPEANHTNLNLTSFLIIA